MELPFTHDEFLNVFAAYNRALWPVAAAFWVITLIAVLRLLRWQAGADRPVAAILSAQWLWSGLVYHILFFRSINPAAAGFGVLFVAQSALLLWRGVLTSALVFRRRDAWGAIGCALIAYSFAYPAVVLLAGMSYPRVPLYAVPCPTVLLTAGLLLLAPRSEVRWLGWIPFIWAVIGGSAAFMLDVRADLALLAAGALLLARATTRA